MKLIRKNKWIEDIIGGHKHHMGDSFMPYKNHVYRVYNLCLMFHEPTEEENDKLAIAAAFHDLGMWPGEEIDYLDPSIRLAQEYLLENGMEEWVEEISLMVEYHHRFRKCSSDFPQLVEIFRKGDWVDATKGMRRFGLKRSQVKEVQGAFENLGFHDNLVKIAIREFRHRPFNPLPMMKW